VKPASYWQQVREVEQRATKGPWKAQMGEWGDNRFYGLVSTATGDDIVELDSSGCYYAGETGSLYMKDDDARFCEMAREALPAALDTIDEQAREIERLRAALEKIISIGDGQHWSIMSDMRGLVYGTARTALRKP